MTDDSPQTPPATLETREDNEERLEVVLTGRLDAASVGALWHRAVETVEASKAPRVVIDVSDVSYCDGSGVGFLIELRRRAGAGKREAELRGLAEDFRPLYDLFSSGSDAERPHRRSRHVPFPEEVGEKAVLLARDVYHRLEFMGELAAALVHAALHPRQVRWKDALLAAERAGVNALPIVALIGFLLGLIMGYQSAQFMKQYGAEIYVADLVAKSVVRELGPLITAILLAGRSGSAFAAELGTMKINEEIDALETMGLDPVRFLVTPRVLAAVTMTPLLTVFANLFGLIGGAVVLLSFGYPLVTYVNQVLNRLVLMDFLGGLFKATVYGLIVAQVGCLRGLETKSGPSAVGESTTTAVVTAIILIAIWDGIFAFVFFTIGI